MDSTTVRMIVDGANQLGMTAGAAWGLWIAFQVFKISAICGTILLVLRVIRGTVESAIDAHHLVGVVKDLTGRYSPNDGDYAKAASLIRKHWND